MQRSTDQILTSHVGSLPRPQQLLDQYRGGSESDALEADLKAGVDDVVRRQIELGIDVVNDGEYGKPMDSDVEYGSFASYTYGRVGGYTLEPVDEIAWYLGTAEGKAFPDFYAGGEAHSKGDVEAQLLLGKATGPLSYEHSEYVRRDVSNLRHALPAGRDAFITALAPGATYDVEGSYYASTEEEGRAFADAMRVEYEAIIDAGFILQLDDPHLVDTFFFNYADGWDLSGFRKWADQHVELVNYAIAGLPTDRIRLHICWGSWKGPHSTDLPLAEVVEQMLRIDAELYSIEAANPRHEHEWKVWRDVRLPDGKILMPGVVTHKTNILEHPELVADRIERYAELVGRENVIAGTDCGMGGRIHPEIAWAKLKALVEGAALASDRLW